MRPPIPAEGASSIRGGAPSSRWSGGRPGCGTGARADSYLLRGPRGVHRGESPRAPTHPLPPMLNYIWSGLIVSSLVFALWYDVGDLARDTYRNGRPLPVTIVVPDAYEADARSVPVEIRLDPEAYRAFYGTDEA